MRRGPDPLTTYLIGLLVVVVGMVGWFVCLLAQHATP